MKTVKTRLLIELYVDCPHCDALIDLLDENDTNGIDHNDAGALLREACPDGYWIDSHEKFELEGVTCSQCKNEFDVRKIDW